MVSKEAQVPVKCINIQYISVCTKYSPVHTLYILEYKYMYQVCTDYRHVHAYTTNHWCNSSLGADIKSLKKGINSQALLGSSMCLRRFSTSSLSFTRPTSWLSSSSNSSHTASSCYITSAIQRYWHSQQCPSASSLSGHQHVVRQRWAKAVDNHLSTIHAERIQISTVLQHMPIPCLSTYQEHTGTYLPGMYCLRTGTYYTCTGTYQVHTH